MRGIVERMTEAGIQLHLTEPARRWLAEKGYDPQFGARPLRRALQRFVENPLSVQLLKGEFQQGDLVVIDEINGQLEFLRNHDASTDYMRFQQDQYTDNLR
jgi:ATP-dependent Clp protease ATP-binding subunit ClpA